MHSFRQIGRILRAGVALIFSLQLPAHGSHDRTIMSANKFGAAETKFEVMFLIENIEILNTSPDIDYSLTGVYRTSAGASTSIGLRSTKALPGTMGSSPTLFGGIGKFNGSPSTFPRHTSIQFATRSAGV
jgi:hypothetical protein